MATKSRTHVRTHWIQDDNDWAEIGVQTSFDDIYDGGGYIPEEHIVWSYNLPHWSPWEWGLASRDLIVEIIGEEETLRIEEDRYE